MLRSLSDHSDRLIVASDSASVVLVKVRESELGWRVTRMQQLLTSWESTFGSSCMQSQLSEFHRACSGAEYVSEQVETVLGETTLTADADEVTLTTLAARLEQSLVQLTGDQPPLEVAIRQVCHPPLSAADSERLRRLDGRSHALLCRTKDQCRAVREQLLNHCDNAQKCDEWLEFVTRIECELSSSLAGNFDTLLTQRKTLQACFLLLTNFRCTVINSAAILLTPEQLLAEDCAGFVVAESHPCSGSRKHVTAR